MNDFDEYIKINKNCFINTDDADDYFETRFGSEIWFKTEQRRRAQSLILATKRINQLSFIGYKKDISQPLEFPRKLTMGNYCNPGLMPEVPQDIKDATCEEAISILEYTQNNGDEVINDSTFNWQSFRLGDVSVTNANSNGTNNNQSILQKPLLSDLAMNFVKKWLRSGYNMENSSFYEVY